MDARLTRDGLLRLELRLTVRQRQALYARFDELRRSRREPLADQECLRLLFADFLVGAEGLLAAPARADDRDGAAEDAPNDGADEADAADPAVAAM